MKRNHLGSSLLIAVLLILGSVATWAEGPYEITVERSVSVTMRDGVILHADIYRPIAPGKYPVLLQRTPYNKDNGIRFGVAAAQKGYVVIFEDVRGRFTSQGEWYPFLHESQDGYDTVEWAAALPYSNGKVGMFGGSYVGATQMLTAIAHPPHLAGICPVVTASNYHDGWTYQGGAFEQWFNESWTSGLAMDTVSHYLQSVNNAVEGSRALPLTDYPLYNFSGAPDASGMKAQFAPYFNDWLAHPDYDDYWKRWSIEEHYPDIQVPALTTAAWYDIFLGGSLRNYAGLKAHAGNEDARQKQRLLVVLGGHAGWGQKIGDVDFGAAAGDGSYGEDAVILRWYDYLFKGVQNEFAGKPVKIFVMGKNIWREESEWPLARAKETKYYLHSSGKANTSSGDGALSTAMPKAEASDRYVYDPMNPAPTVGGPLCCDIQHLAPGPRDQKSVETREDVLVYSTEAFEKDIEVTGPVTLDLYAKSSAVDTDFTAKLVDVWPNGFVQNLTEGILRARHRDSQTTAKNLVPGQVYKLKIDLWATSNVFLKGHKLRVEISSSNFPRFDRNMNTGEDAKSATHGVKATNVIYHDAQHPSTLVLPVIPE